MKQVGETVQRSNTPCTGVAELDFVALMKSTLNTSEFKNYTRHE
jgi:hypothetical protein